MTETVSSFSPPERKPQHPAVTRLADTVLAFTHLGTHPGSEAERNSKHREQTLQRLEQWLRLISPAIETWHTDFWQQRAPQWQMQVMSAVNQDTAAAKVSLTSLVSPLPLTYIRQEKHTTKSSPIMFNNESYSLCLPPQRLLTDYQVSELSTRLRQELTSRLPDSYGLSVQFLYVVANIFQRNYDEQEITPGLLCKITVAPSFK